MKYDPLTEECPLPYTAFRSCVVPRPVAWISTKSESGICNLAPFSQAQLFNFNPPMVSFTIGHYPNGLRKDTSINIEKTGWFVWNFCTEELKDAMNTTSIIVPDHVDEFELAGLEKEKAELCDVSMVAASPIKMECELFKFETIDCPKWDANLGSYKIDMIIGLVRQIHIKESAVDAEGKIDIEKLRPIARMGYIDYTTVNNTFPMKMPISKELIDAVSPEILAKIMAGGG